ncbi:MAG: hypothetical protein ACPG77_20645, partial [Nannocystaceae bacterium]
GSCQEALDKLNSAQDSLEAYATKHPDEVTAVAGLSTWLETAAKLRKDSQTLLQALDSKNTDIGPLLEALNGSLTRGDTLKFSEAGS